MNIQRSLALLFAIVALTAFLVDQDGPLTEVSEIASNAGSADDAATESNGSSDQSMRIDEAGQHSSGDYFVDENGNIVPEDDEGQAQGTADGPSLDSYATDGTSSTQRAPGIPPPPPALNPSPSVPDAPAREVM